MNPICFNNNFASLGENFYQRVEPTPVQNPAVIRFNDQLAAELGWPLGAVSQDELAQIFSGNRVPDGAEPLAMAYAGHQFGHFVPQLGDGRAILLGEVVMADGRSMEMQLKGSGQTYFSRNGDGRAALGPVLREYIVSEAMARLGVPTTRALAAVTTGEEVARERLLPGGIITRMAKSFVRVGTFQFYAARGDLDSVKILADHVIDRLYPQLRDADNPYRALLQQVVQGQASLIAKWMQLGFIHGVMNTDNMSVAGETIDYGPCAFMDAYSHTRVFSSIDHGGRYAYSQQPSIGLWNLTRLAETLAPLFDGDSETAVKKAQSVLEGYIDTYNNEWLDGMRAKCGLSDTVNKAVSNNDRELVESLFELMHARQADFTLVFSSLSQLVSVHGEADKEFQKLFGPGAEVQQWLQRWRERLQHERQTDAQRQARMQCVNPVYIPRNHQLEAAIRAAEDHNDFSLFHELCTLLEKPFAIQPGKQHYQLPPQPEEEVKHTFCGT